MVEKYVVKEAEKMENSRYVEDDEEVKDTKEIIEKLDELIEEGSDCFKRCSDKEKKSVLVFQWSQCCVMDHNL